MKSYKDKFVQETYFTIDYGDLDEIIQAEYENEDFTCVLGQHNDSTLEFSIDGQFEDWEENNLQRYLKDFNQDEWNTTRWLMNDLCRKGLIWPGNYLIQICW